MRGLILERDRIRVRRVEGASFRYGNLRGKDIDFSNRATPSDEITVNPLQKSQLTAHEATHTMGGTPSTTPMAPFDLNQSVAAALGASTDQILQGKVHQQQPNKT